MVKNNDPKKILTGWNTRWSYCNVWEPRGIDGSRPAWSVSLIVPKSDKETLAKIEKAIQAAYEEGASIWIMEIGEMAGMRKAEQEKLKAFFGRQDDKYRAAFGRRVQSHPRQSVMFGTTNAESGFLRDITGNRRYWPVAVPGTGTRKPWELTQDDINQIWAEVLVLVAKGEPLTLPADIEERAKVEQNSAMEKDEREGVVRLFLETLLPENWAKM